MKHTNHLHHQAEQPFILNQFPCRFLIGFIHQNTSGLSIISVCPSYQFPCPLEIPTFPFPYPLEISVSLPTWWMSPHLWRVLQTQPCITAHFSPGIDGWMKEFSPKTNLLLCIEFQGVHRDKSKDKRLWYEMGFSLSRIQVPVWTRCSLIAHVNHHPYHMWIPIHLLKWGLIT